MRAIKVNEEENGRVKGSPVDRSRPCENHDLSLGEEESWRKTGNEAEKTHERSGVLVKLSTWRRTCLSDGNAIFREKRHSSSPPRSPFYERKFENDMMLKAMIIRFSVTDCTQMRA